MNLSLIKTKLKNEFPITQRENQTYPQKAAVLVILYPKNNKTHVLMTKRALHLRSHAGEISFPGGVYEEDDDDLRNAVSPALPKPGTGENRPNHGRAKRRVDGRAGGRHDLVVDDDVAAKEPCIQDEEVPSVPELHEGGFMWEVRLRVQPKHKRGRAQECGKHVQKRVEQRRW